MSLFIEIEYKRKWDMFPVVEELGSSRFFHNDTEASFSIPPVAFESFSGR